MKLPPRPAAASSLCAIIAATTLLTACADPTTGRAGSASTAGVVATPTITQQCPLTDISAIRANISNRIPFTAATAVIHSAVASTDSLSFIAKVSSADLIAAGITPPQAATPDAPAIMVVSHGDWSPDDLPISTAGGGQPIEAGTSTPSPAPPPRIAWIITLFANDHSQPSDITYAPDDACFKS